MQLSFAGRGLESIPEEVFEHAATLEHLDLSGNRFTSLPDRLIELRSLKRLFFSNNPFESVPEVLGQLPALEMVGFKSCALTSVPATSLPQRLRWLILTDNRLISLPEELGRRPRLQKLALAGNRLTALPKSIINLRALELLRISANQLATFPTELFELPRLSWLAFAGNPFCTRPRVEAESIEWNELTVHEVLGQGASGVISRATRKNGTDVAVKVFKGAVTSDGWPEDEVTACLVAGAHPNLIGVIGRVINHPDGADALVLELMPQRFHPLGGPPDFQSCTRDVMPANWKPTPDQAFRIAKNVAAVGAHLHSKGVLHGDLYAHNTRVDQTGDTLVGDFGAASLITGHRHALERIELRAFGALIDDLISCGAPERLGELKSATRFADLLAG